MSTRQIRKRLERLAQRFELRDDGKITLEQLCRSLWRADKQRYLAQWRKTSGAFHYAIRTRRRQTESTRAAWEIDMILNLRKTLRLSGFDVVGRDENQAVLGVVPVHLL